MEAFAHIDRRRVQVDWHRRIRYQQLLRHLFEDCSDGFYGRNRNEDGDSRGEFDLDRVHGRLGNLDTQKCACLAHSIELAFPLGIGSRRPADRLIELRAGNIGSFALGDTFGLNLGSFEDAKRDIDRGSLRDLG